MCFVATGEAAAVAALKAGAALDDFVSGPKELLRGFLATAFPAPPAAAARDEEDAMLAAAPRKRRRGAAATAAVTAGPLGGPDACAPGAPAFGTPAALASTSELVSDTADGENSTTDSDATSSDTDSEGDGTMHALGDEGPGRGARKKQRGQAVGAGPGNPGGARAGTGLRSDGYLTEAAHAAIQVCFCGAP